jgi:hypothetical protein
MLANEESIKVGARIQHDIKSLFKIEEFHTTSLCDLDIFSKQLEIAQTGFRNVAAIFLCVRISKNGN